MGLYTRAYNQGGALTRDFTECVPVFHHYLNQYPGEVSGAPKCQWCDSCTEGGRCMDEGLNCGETEGCSNLQPVKTQSHLCTEGAGCEKGKNCPAPCTTHTDCTSCLASKGELLAWICIWVVFVLFAHA